MVIASKKTETWTKNSTPDSRGTSPAASAGRRKRKFPEKYSSYATDECSRPTPEVVKERKVNRDLSSSSQTKTATPKPSASAKATNSLDIAAAAAPSTAFKEEIDDDVILLSDSEEEDEEENTVVRFPKMKRIVAAAADHPAPSSPKIPILQEEATEETRKVLEGLQLQCPWCGISLESSQELKTHATHDHNKGMGRETKHFYC